VPVQLEIKAGVSCGKCRAYWLCIRTSQSFRNAPKSQQMISATTVFPVFGSVAM